MLSSESPEIFAPNVSCLGQVLISALTPKVGVGVHAILSLVKV